MTAIHHPAFADLIPEDVANRVKARRHLAAMNPARSAQLEDEWAAAEFHREPISAELRENTRRHRQHGETTMIRSYADVTFPFDTEFADGHGKARLLAAVVNDYSTHIIGYSHYGDPDKSCSQALEWDAEGKFGGGGYPTMDLVPPPGLVEDHLNLLNSEIADIRKRLADNPEAPAAWRSADERRLGELERKAANLFAPHIWGAAA